MTGGFIPVTEETNRFRHPMSDERWRNLFRVLGSAFPPTVKAVLRHHARTIHRHIQSLDPLMDRYCRETYPMCTDPCCLAGGIFYNLADILYLFGLERALPLGQTRTRPTEPCRYLGLRGCLIPRVYRPYVCVWFLCELQTERLLREPARIQRQVAQAYQEIRRLRGALLQTADPIVQEIEDRL